MCKNKQAFTLIELLVVVLIIGILAAVAVPQYQLAVEKSRATEGLTILKQIAMANKAHFLEKGEYATDINALDIEVPGTDIVSASMNRKQTKWFEYGSQGYNRPDVIAVSNRLPQSSFYVFNFVDDNTICCYGHSTKGINFCKNLSHVKIKAIHKVDNIDCYEIF